MGALVNLESDNLSVEPGQTATTELSLVNTGSIVEQFTIMVLGDPAPWTSADPPVVSLFPGGQQTVTLRFSPPRAFDTPSGPVPFGVKVIPSNEPEESVTEEGEVAVGSFTDVGAELVPRVATGRLAGHQKLAVDSRGNVPLPVTISAVDPADALRFRIRPQTLMASPGEARYIRFRIAPRQRFWRGPPQNKPYKVQVAPEHESPLVLDGALTQKSVLPKWFLPLVGALAALALLWFLVLRPIVHNDAVNASKTALAVQAAQTRALANQVAAANQSAQSAKTAAAAATAIALHKAVTTTTKPTATTTKPTATTTKPAATTTTTIKPAAAPNVIVNVPTTPTTTTVPPTTTTTQPQPITGPNDGQMFVRAPPGGSGSNSITINPQNTLQIGDLIIQNVSGSAPGAQAIVGRLPAGTGQKVQDLLIEDLGTLTDQEYSFASPMVLTSGQKLVLEVNGCPQSFESVVPFCEVNLYYTGPLTQPPPTTTTAAP